MSRTEIKKHAICKANGRRQQKERTRGKSGSNRETGSLGGAQLTKCPLYQSRTHAVPGDGTLSNKVMLIGEGPGRKEYESGHLIEPQARQYLVGYHPTVRFYHADLGGKVKEDSVFLKQTLENLAI